MNTDTNPYATEEQIERSHYSPAESDLLRISKSSLMTYMGCPRQFYWRYCAGLPSAPATEQMIRGGLIHEVMEYGLKGGPEEAPAKAEEMGVGQDPAVDSLMLLIHQIAHDMGGFNILESEIKHQVFEEYGDHEILWVGLIDGLLRFCMVKNPDMGSVIVELKTGKMNMSKLGRTRKELLYYHRLLSLMDENYPEPTHLLYLSPDYEHDPNDKLLLEGNKRGKRLWLVPQQGIAILEPVTQRSINAFSKSLTNTIDNLKLQQWPMKWNDYFCPLWCEFCMNCEAELTGEFNEGEWLE